MLYLLLTSGHSQPLLGTVLNLQAPATSPVVLVTHTSAAPESDCAPPGSVEEKRIRQSSNTLTLVFCSLLRINVSLTKAMPFVFPADIYGRKNLKHIHTLGGPSRWRVNERCRMRQDENDLFV